jgi:hypothetical protein
MFFGVPIFAVIYTLIKEEVDKRVAMREAREAYEASHAQATQETEKVNEGSVESEDVAKDSEKAEDSTPQGEEEKLNETAENAESEDNK